MAVHVLEHFYPWDALPTIKEWRRVLKPDGYLSLELPCMDKVFRYIANCLNEKRPISPTFSWLPLWGDPQYQRPDMLHQWGYFKDDVICLLEDAGFCEVRDEYALYHYPSRDMRITGMKE